MKNNIVLILVCFLGLQNANSQTYLQGDNVITLNGAATCDQLPQTKRLTIDQAFTKLKEINPDPIEKSSKEMVGEFWLIDNMLVNIVTRKITSENKKVDLYDRQKAYAPEILYRKGTQPDRTRTNDYFSEIKSVNNFDVLVDYYKTRSFDKNFLIQDKNGKFKVMGTIYVKKQDATKAHALINTILNKLSFK